MTALILILAALAFIAQGVSNKRTRTEILAAEQRQIERERMRGLAANVAAFDALGKSANR